MVVTMARYLVPLLTTGSGGGDHGHILLHPLLGKGRGGGDDIPTHSFLFWEKGRGEGDHGQISRSPSD